MPTSPSHGGRNASPPTTPTRTLRRQKKPKSASGIAETKREPRGRERRLVLDLLLQVRGKVAEEGRQEDDQREVVLPAPVPIFGRGAVALGRLVVRLDVPRRVAFVPRGQLVPDLAAGERRRLDHLEEAVLPADRGPRDLRRTPRRALPGPPPLGRRRQENHPAGGPGLEAVRQDGTGHGIRIGPPEAGRPAALYPRIERFS